MYYWKNANKILRYLYPNWHWEMPADGKKIYLSFDDGPHPTITPWVLEQLKNYNAKASFFCIGNNVQLYPNIFEQILNEGHTVGNHTMNHRNGWKTDDATYFNDIYTAGNYIDSKLFRPPYGRMTRFQGKSLRDTGWEIIMWTILCGDFDRSLTPEKCLSIVQKKMSPGSIIVFHDSEKAWDRLRYILPRILQQYSDEGYIFESINMSMCKRNNGK